MNEKIDTIRQKYRKNPGWYWLLACVFLFPLLPEYISPFILFAGFIVFKLQWSREGRKAKTGTLGKLMMLFMTYALVSTLWSDTKFSTFATASLWWGMFLIQVMIYNLARDRKKIDSILNAMAISGAITGVIGAIQSLTYLLNKFGHIGKEFVLVTPLYKKLDKFIYTSLPFEISTKTFDSRASGAFSNPNLLATYMIIAYPISIYLFLNAKAKNQKLFYFFINVFISAGMSSTFSRAGCLIALAGWLLMFAALFKRHWKDMLLTLIPTVTIIVPSLLTRYGIILNGNGKEAAKSSATHFDIWSGIVNYLTTNIKAFIIGTGFGCEQTGVILSTLYNLKKPHSHNFVLEIWAELGIIGIAIFFAVIICAFVKMMKTNTDNGKKSPLVFCVFTSFALYLLFGLSDFIFNSPKQIIFLFMLLGLTQAINYCYEKTVITDSRELLQVTKR